jgi:hypothetical protein
VRQISLSHTVIQVVAYKAQDHIELFLGGWLRTGRIGDRIPVEARFSAPFQTGAGAHPASYKMGIRVIYGGKAAGAWRSPTIPK